MLWTDEIQGVLAGPVSFSYVRGEVIELWEAIRALDPENIREEFSDVCCLGAAAVYAATGWNIPAPFARPAFEKFRGRLSVWERIFEEAGIPFDQRALVEGGNFNKPHKVRRALELGRQLAEQADRGD